MEALKSGIADRKRWGMVQHILCWASMALLALLLAGTARASVQEAEEALARKDFVAARKFLEDPARQGDAVAQDMLGHMLLFGRGGPVDAGKAAELLRKAADQGRSEAQNSMGVIYMTGLDGKLDPVEGLAWFRKAAENGHSYAMFNLGRAAEQGLGTEKSMAEAESWYRRAADNGNEAARQRLEELALSRNSASKNAPPPRNSAMQKQDARQSKARGETPPARPRTEAAAKQNKKAPEPHREAPKRRADDKTPLPLMYKLSPDKAPDRRIDGKPALDLVSPEVSRAPDGLHLSFFLYNTGPKSSGTLSFYRLDAEGKRTRLRVEGDPAFSLQRQVYKTYVVEAAPFSGGGVLLIEALASGRPSLEARLEVPAEP